MEDSDEPRRDELKEDWFERMACAVAYWVGKLVDRKLEGTTVDGTTVGIRGLLMANERTLSTPPELRTRVTKQVRLSMKYFLSFFMLLRIPQQRFKTSIGKNFKVEKQGNKRFAVPV